MSERAQRLEQEAKRESLTELIEKLEGSEVELVYTEMEKWIAIVEARQVMSSEVTWRTIKTTQELRATLGGRSTLAHNGRWCVRLEMRAGNSDKFYEVSADMVDADYKGRYGRRGSKGRERSFGSLVEVSKILQDKLRKGYQVTTGYGR